MLDWEREDIDKLRRRIESGEGELVTNSELYEAWGDFSDAFDASWLICDDLTYANFVAWLIRERRVSI